MSIGDFEDTLLWIGRSITEDRDLVARVEQATGRKLIARFGIGLLSCFKAAKKISVLSNKTGEVPFSANITSVLDEVRTEQALEKTVGTSFILELKDSYSDSDFILDAFRYYFRSSQFAHVYIKQEFDAAEFYGRERGAFLSLDGDEIELDSLLAEERDE